MSKEAHEKKLALLKRLRDEIAEADRLADTEAAELFHAARTARTFPGRRRERYEAVIWMDKDGEGLSLGTPERVEGGTYLRTEHKRAVGTVSLPVRPFMSTEGARRRLVDELSRLVEGEKEYLAMVARERGVAR